MNLSGTDAKDDLVRYAIVGGIATVIDIGLFNLFRYFGAILEVTQISILSKIASVGFAVTFAYFGHKYWTFGHRNSGSKHFRQFPMFVIANVVGLLIALSCLYVSREVLGMTSLLADNISANFVGLILATAFRFIVARKWIFVPVDEKI